MTTLPVHIVAQLRQIQLKLNERTIGSPLLATAINNPVWNDSKGTPSQ